MALATITPMAFMVEDRMAHRFTQDEVMALAEVSCELERVELLRGVLVDRVTPSPPHADIQARLLMWLARGVDPKVLEVRVEAPIRVPDRYSLPQPDLMVCHVTGPMDHPSAAPLAVEVAVSSLRSDRNVKAPLYAASGIPEYWIVDVNARLVLVLTEPRADGYASQRTLARADAAAPAHVAIEPLELARLFAGLD